MELSYIALTNAGHVTCTLSGIKDLMSLPSASEKMEFKPVHAFHIGEKTSCSPDLGKGSTARFEALISARY